MVLADIFGIDVIIHKHFLGLTTLQETLKLAYGEETVGGGVERLQVQVGILVVLRHRFGIINFILQGEPALEETSFGGGQVRS